MSILGRLKTAIKGNPVLKEHEVGKHTSSAGPGLLWKVYDGVKKSTHQHVSVFIFSKHSPEIDKLSKDHREELFEMLRKGPAFLAKLRHPKILTLHHTVEESSDCIAFATEPVFCCLANILGHYDNLPSPLPLSIKEFQLHSLEGHYGLLQITEALSFLHNDVKMIHGNINPENVIITKNGDWKLAGFNFASYDNYQSTAQTSFHFKEYNSRRVLSPNPHLDYLAPEYILTTSYDTRSDLYSIGMLAYSLYNGGNPLYQNNNNTRSFKHNAELISRISESSLGDTPLLLRSLVRELLATEPSVRPDSLQIIKHGYFDDVLVSTLKYLDSLYAKSDMEKSQWFKTVLGKMVIRLPKRVVHQRVIPQLVAEFRNHKMIPFILPIVLLIADDCTMREYSDLILPILIPVFMIHDPIQIPLIILQKMDLILKKTSPDEMKQHILPMILATLESENGQVQELCVSILPTFAEMIDYSSMKHSIIPRLTTLCVSSSTVSLSVKCLVTLGQIVDTLDKAIILEQVIPVIVKIPSKEPGILMGILGIFHKAMTSKTIGFSKELIAQRVLPYLIPLSIQNTLNKNQFGQFMIVIKELLKKMESDHTLYLDQVAKMEEQTKSTVEFAQEVSQYKASEDALKGIANMSGGGGGEDGLITSRVGGASKGGVATTTGQSSNNTMVDDMFAGLNVSDLSNSNKATPTTSNKTTPTMSGMKRIDFSGNQSSISQQQPPSLGTWDVPNTSSKAPPTSVTPNLFTGSMNTAKQSPNMGGVNKVGGAGGILQPTTASSSMGWTKESNSGGIGTGPSNMGTGMLQPSPVNMGTGMLQPSSASGWSNSINEPSSGMGTGILQPSSSSGWSSNVSSGMGTGPLNMGMGVSQPNPNSGWSSNINESSSGIGTGPSNMGIMGVLQPSSSGWSSSIGESSSGTSLESGWSSSNMGTGPSNTGWNMNQSSFGTGTQSSGTGMGTGMGLLQPNPVSDWSQSSSISQANTTGWNTNQARGVAISGQHPHTTVPMTTSQQTNQSTGQGMAPGANPFADFNSLI